MILNLLALIHIPSTLVRKVQTLQGNLASEHVWRDSLCFPKYITHKLHARTHRGDLSEIYGIFDNTAGPIVHFGITDKTEECKIIPSFLTNSFSPLSLDLTH